MKEPSSDTLILCNIERTRSTRTGDVLSDSSSRKLSRRGLMREGSCWDWENVWKVGRLISSALMESWTDDRKVIHLSNRRVLNKTVPTGKVCLWNTLSSSGERGMMERRWDRRQRTTRRS